MWLERAGILNLWKNETQLDVEVTEFIALSKSDTVVVKNCFAHWCFLSTSALQVSLRVDRFEKIALPLEVFVSRRNLLRSAPLWGKHSGAGTLTGLSHPLGSVSAEQQSRLWKLQLEQNVNINVSRTKSAHLLTCLNSEALALELNLAWGPPARSCLQDRNAPRLALQSLPSGKACDVCPRGACPVRASLHPFPSSFGMFSGTEVAGLRGD